MILLFVVSSFSVMAQTGDIITGADQFQNYLSLLQNKNVALVINQTSTVKDQSLADFLLSKKIRVKQIFAPEHGFRGDADGGATIKNSVDTKTGVPIISIYGSNRKPLPEQLSGIDLVIFDIQDVGCRFYTYISSLHYVMEACAENKVKLLILDRPNPNGDYCDGPVLKSEFRSFVGMDPIPVVHGCTVGELAQMINGEGWLKDGVKADIQVVPVKNYTHRTKYELPVKPSPNLPNYRSIRLYPSLCCFEATSVSVGRGTEYPFQVLGYPNQEFGKFSFIPKSIVGMETNPMHKNVECYGQDLRDLKEAPQFTLSFFLNWYHKFPDEKSFIKSERRLNLLMGNDLVIKLIREGKSEQEIRQSWQSELNAYKEMRKKYLIYPE
jgi:uncharacterized protein YbbC (DUF1343 family)